MSRLTIALVVACLSACPAAADPKRVLALDDLYRFDGPRDVAMSPDGKSAVYVRQWIDPATKAERQALWRVPGAGEKPVAAEPGAPDARAPVYSPDGRWIAFLSTRARPEGWKSTPPVPPESDPATDVWVIPAAGGPAVPLAGPDKPYGRAFNDGFYGRLAFSPDGTRLAFVADDGADPRTPAEKTNGVAVARDDQGEGYTGYGPARLWVAHLDPKPEKCAATKVDRLTDGTAWYGDPQWFPDGRALVVHANRTVDRESVRYSINKDFDLWRIDATTGAVRPLTTANGPDVSPRVSPDGTKLAYLSVPAKGAHREPFRLMVLDLSGRSGPRVVVDQSPGAADAPTPSFPLPVDCWDGTGHLVYTGERGVRSEPVRIDPETRTAEPTGRAARRAMFTPPGNAFLHDVALGEQTVVTWTSPDGQAVEGVLTLPPAEAKATAPYRLIVYPHGGPHGRATRGFDFTGQLFAANGYAVFQPNFRGSLGYGRAFAAADRGDFGGGDMRDILSGVDKLVADGIADRDRLFVYGVSYGGYMTSWLVGQTDCFKAAVAQNAVTDLTMMWSLSDLPSWTEWEFGGRPWEVPEKMRQHSPLTFAGKVKTPTLILHSAADRRCPPPMGRAFHQALKARGVPTGLVVYPDEGHGIRQPRHRADVLRRVLDWFAEHERT